ncbi:unnamed protein product, partial [Umbelopsis vinacea]
MTVSVLMNLVDVVYTSKHIQSFPWIYRYMFAVAVIAICALSFSVTLVALFARRFWSQPNLFPYRASDGTTLRGSYKSFSGKPYICNLFVNSNILVLILSRILGMIYVLNVTSQNSLDFDLLLADLCLSGAKGFFVSIIFFSDPAVISSAADLKEYLRCRYVDEYYELEEIDASTTGSSRRKSVRKISGITRRSTDISQESTQLEMITQYKYPRLA